MLYPQDGVCCGGPGLNAPQSEKISFVLLMLENLYNKCAGYNLRYCPLRGVRKRGKHLTSTFKDLIIIVCFLIANFIVFVNLTTRMAIHLYLLLTETVVWLKRSIMKSECEETFQFNSRIKQEDRVPK